MKTLQTIYPYGPNERARKHDSEVAVGKLFFSIPRTMQLSAIFEKWHYHRPFYKHAYHSKRH